MKGMCGRQRCLAFIAVVAAAFQISAAELVAHWRMDESAALSVLAPAAGTNSILPKNGMVAGAAAVDGTGVHSPYGSVAQLVGSKGLIPATNDFSVFLWAAYTNEPSRTTQKQLFS